MPPSFGVAAIEDDINVSRPRKVVGEELVKFLVRSRDDEDTTGISVAVVGEFPPRPQPELSGESVGSRSVLLYTGGVTEQCMHALEAAMDQGDERAETERLRQAPRRLVAAQRLGCGRWIASRRDLAQELLSVRLVRSLTTCVSEFERLVSGRCRA